MFGGLFGLFLSSMETSPTIVAQQANAANAAAAASAAPHLKGVPATPAQQIIENPSVKVRGSLVVLVRTRLCPFPYHPHAIGR